MKFRLVLLLLLLTLAAVLSAGNSVFSYYGPPNRNYGNDIYGITMGDVGIADIFRQNTGYGNPAILGSNVRTLFSTGMKFGWTGYKSKDGEVKSFRDNSLDFPLFSIGIPVNRHHFGFQFNSFSSGEMQNQMTGTVILDQDGQPADTLDITEIQAVDQYIYRADLMYAIHYPHLNLGAGLNYYFGHDVRQFRQDSSFDFDTVEKTNSSYLNPGATLGATVDYQNTALGFYYSLGSDLEGNKTYTNNNSTQKLGKTHYSIPDQTGLGLTTKLAGEFKISADYQYSFDKSGKYTTSTRNSWKLGIGFAQEPGSDARHTFLAQFPKRVGFSYRMLPFTVNGHSLTETAISTGVTFPVKQSENRLDFGLQYLMRGNVDQHNLQDRSLMFIVGITGFDILSKEFDRSAPREIPQEGEITE